MSEEQDTCPYSSGSIQTQRSHVKRAMLTPKRSDVQVRCKMLAKTFSVH